MYLEERLFKGDGHDSSGHTTTPWENAIILVSKCYSMALCVQRFKTILKRFTWDLNKKPFPIYYVSLWQLIYDIFLLILRRETKFSHSPGWNLKQLTGFDGKHQTNNIQIWWSIQLVSYQWFFLNKKLHGVKKSTI